MKSKHIFLSHNLNEDLSGYANGERINIERISKISEGSTSNNSKLMLPSHYGTHIDFPFHFCPGGKTVDDYSATDFIFRNVEIIGLDISISKNKIIRSEQIEKVSEFSKETDFLLIKTGYSELRSSDCYWNNNPGFHPDVAGFLRKNLPNLKAIGFDSISLSSFTDRPLGRTAHKEFLCTNDLLIVEDMDLSKVNENTEIVSLIIAPLRFKEADGTPVTAIAEIISN